MPPINTLSSHLSPNKESLLSSLDSRVFPSNTEKELFIKWLSIHDHIAPVFENRTTYAARKGNMLVPVRTEKGDISNVNKLGAYTLYMPNDMRIGELPTIIRHINHATFGEILPDYASTREVQVKVVLIVDMLLKGKSVSSTKTELNTIQKALTKYYLLYTELTSSAESQKLSDPEYRKSYILIASGQEKYKNIQEKIVHIHTREKISDLHSQTESLISQELLRHLNESVYERGIHMVQEGLQTITQTEQENIIKQAIADGFTDPSLSKMLSALGIADGSTPNGTDLDTLGKGKEKIITHIPSKDLDIESRYLRDAIEIDKYKKELVLVRESKDKVKIDKLELEAANAIAREMYKYPYRALATNLGYTPRGVIDKKEVYCVGFSLIGHAMLSELKIKHQGISIPSHSALSVDIGGTQYILDGTLQEKLVPYNYVPPGALDGADGTLKYQNGIVYSRGIQGDAESIIQSLIYNNLGASLDEQGKYLEAIRLYQKSLSLDPRSTGVYYNLGNSIDNYRKNTQFSNLFYAISMQMSGDTTNVYDANIGTKYHTEQERIKEYMAKKNYEGLRIYVMGLLDKELTKKR